MMNLRNPQQRNGYLRVIAGNRAKARLKRKYPGVYKKFYEEELAKFDLLPGSVTGKGVKLGTIRGEYKS